MKVSLSSDFTMGWPPSERICIVPGAVKNEQTGYFEVDMHAFSEFVELMHTALFGLVLWSDDDGNLMVQEWDRFSNG